MPISLWIIFEQQTTLKQTKVLQAFKRLMENEVEECIWKAWRWQSEVME